MFSTGQLIFTTLFVIAFIAIIYMAYRRDKGTHSKNYKGVLWVLVSFITFVITLFIIKYFLKN